MIEQELLLLGLLREGPCHGYDIKIKIKEILSLFAGIEEGSIYYPLRILEKKGLVQKRIAKSGKRPKKIVYSLTPRGASRFDELLSESIVALKRPQFSLDLSLYFLRFLKPALAKRKLMARLKMLNKISAGMQKMLAQGGSRRNLSLILEHNLRMLEAESLFLSRLLATL